MTFLAVDLLAIMLVLLFSPALLTAGAFARRGDCLALRRLRITLPVTSLAGALPPLWAIALKIDEPSGMLIACSLALGTVGALVALLLHSVDQRH
jgi:hypothetical protein